jgi:hypothetical protein
VFCFLCSSFPFSSLIVWTVLFCSILFCPFHSILFFSIHFCSVLFCFFLLYYCITITVHKNNNVQFILMSNSICILFFAVPLYSVSLFFFLFYPMPFYLPVFYRIQFSSVLFLFRSMPFCSALTYSVRSILFCSVLSCSFLSCFIPYVTQEARSSCARSGGSCHLHRLVILQIAHRLVAAAWTVLMWSKYLTAAVLLLLP